MPWSVVVEKANLFRCYWPVVFVRLNQEVWSALFFIFWIFSNAKSYASAVHAVIILFVYALVCRLQLYAALREANIKLFVILVSLTWSLWPSPDSYSWFNKRSWFPTSVSLFLGNQSIFYMFKVWNTNKKSIFLTISYYYEWSLVSFHLFSF